MLAVVKVQVPERTLSVKAEGGEGTVVAGFWHAWAENHLAENAGAGRNVSSTHKYIAARVVLRLAGWPSSTLKAGTLRVDRGKQMQSHKSAT